MADGNRHPAEWAADSRPAEETAHNAVGDERQTRSRLTGVTAIP